MRRRILVPAVLVGLALTAPSVVAQGGTTPVSPKKGDSVPSGERATFKQNVSGPGKVYVHVCKSKKKNADGLICSKASIGKARKKNGSRYEYKAKFFDFPAFWLNNPGAYYWQAYRISCENGTGDCRIEGPTVKFRVS